MKNEGKETHAQHKVQREAKREERRQERKKHQAGRALERQCDPRNRRSQFSQRFAALPAEIKAIIIAFVVKAPEEIRLSRLRSSRWDLAWRFRRDKELYAEAKKHHARGNTFSLRLGRYFDPPLGTTIRNLTVDFEIKIRGGDIGQLGTLSELDMPKFAAIPQQFPYLESFTCRVRNTGKIGFLAAYTSNGAAWFAKYSSGLMMTERLGKMDTILNLVRDFQFMQYGREQRPVCKVVIFKQEEDENVHSTTVLMMDPKTRVSPGLETYEEMLGFLMAVPRAKVYFEERSLAHARRARGPSISTTSAQE